jgi:hypothetical protein
MRAGLVPSSQLVLQSAGPDLIPACSTLRFTNTPLLEMGLTFPPPPQQYGSRKRGRAAADIDGEHSCLQKKKRRLRLTLITSRLSPQFSYPATNIVDRGSSKIAVWAKQRGMGQNLLRKAAILNRIRCHAASVKKTPQGTAHVSLKPTEEQRHIEMARLTLTYGSIDTHTRPVLSQTQSVPPLAAVRVGGHFIVSGSPTTSPSNSPPTSRSPSPTSPSPPLSDPVEHSHSDCRSPNEAYAYSLPSVHIPRKHYTPPPPSPLGLSNYDAFDSEDEIPDPYSHFDDIEDIEPPAYIYAGARHDSPMANSPCASSTRFEHTTRQIIDPRPQSTHPIAAPELEAQTYTPPNSARDGTWSTGPRHATAPSPNAPLSHSPNFVPSVSVHVVKSPNFAPSMY